MWPRVSEIVLGLWLLASPFTFQHSRDHISLWAVDLSAGILTIILALASVRTTFRKAHLATLGVALALVAFGYFSPSSPAQQNDIRTGLIIMMLAIIPSEAHLPPRPWREYLSKRM
jgi:hypothetical protein